MVLRARVSASVVAVGVAGDPWTMGQPRMVLCWLEHQLIADFEMF